MGWTPRRPFPTTTRRRILQRHPTCQHCGTAPSTIADHIIPVAEGGTDNIDNGQGLCNKCHNTKTRQEIARGHARWQQRRERQKRTPEPHPGLATE